MHGRRFHRRHRHYQYHPARHIAFGLGVMGIGSLVLLDNLHIFNIRLLQTFWPLALTLWGLSRLFMGRNYGNWLFGMALALFGVFMTADNLGLVQFHPRDWWPALIILAGLSIVLRGAFPRYRRAMADAVDSSTLEHGERVDINAAFSAVNQQNDSRSFKGGRIDVSFGSVELDLRQAAMDGPEAMLEISARFAGVELRVPRDWLVVVNVAPTLGGVNDQTVPPMNPTQRLMLRGDAVFGGIEVKN